MIKTFGMVKETGIKGGAAGSWTQGLWLKLPSAIIPESCSYIQYKLLLLKAYGGGCLHTLIQWKTSSSVLQSGNWVNRTVEAKMCTIQKTMIPVLSREIAPAYPMWLEAGECWPGLIEVMVYPSLFLYFSTGWYIFPYRYFLGGTIPTSLLVLVKIFSLSLLLYKPFHLSFLPLSPFQGSWDCIIMNGMI